MSTERSCCICCSIASLSRSSDCGCCVVVVVFAVSGGAGGVCCWRGFRWTKAAVMVFTCCGVADGPDMATDRT